MKLSNYFILTVAGIITFNSTSLNAQTIYTPPTKVNPINSVLIESSGLQWAGNSLWSFNDGGGAAAIYRIDTISNALLQTVNLGGATNVDWEDIAFDGTHMYIGDFGNNYDGGRNDLKIYKFPISAIPDYSNNAIATIDASQIDIINFSYKNHFPLTATSNNNTRYDCEAMLVDNGQIHLFTKNWLDYTTTHYVINGLLSGNYIADSVENLNTGYLVTAADKAPSSNTVLLLGYLDTTPGNHFIHKLTNYNGGSYFNGNVQKINLPNALTMGQAEGITFRTDNYGYISNERLQRTVFNIPITINQMLKSFNTNNFPSQVVLPLQLLFFQATNINNSAKLAWDFDTPVSQLQLQKSIGNTNNFIAIKNYDTSKNNFYYDQINTQNIYYRLVWSNGNGGSLYSNIVALKTNTASSLNSFHLKLNGEFNFILNGNATNYSICIVDVNGRTINKIPEKDYLIGYNKINLNAGLFTNQIVFVTLSNKSETITKKVMVE